MARPKSANIYIRSADSNTEFMWANVTEDGTVLLGFASLAAKLEYFNSIEGTTVRNALKEEIASHSILETFEREALESAFGGIGI